MSRILVRMCFTAFPENSLASPLDQRDTGHPPSYKAIRAAEEFHDKF